MNTQYLTVIDIAEKAVTKGSYTNVPLAVVNNHVIRMSVMTEPYFWHLHPDSDEGFLVIEGSVFIDLDNTTVELLPGQLFTIPKNVKHRTRTNGARSVNLTFEGSSMTTIRVDG